ncbi:MAG: DUF4831 family protein [Alistipes sp.]|nr:DUF4831 family protein [Alistipes sp.]
MKRYFAIFALLILSMVGAELSAQQLVKKRIGMYKENGAVVLSEAQTSLVVDLVVEEEHFVSGPYARYAQKLLGTRASLIDYTAYDIVEANVAIAEDGEFMATERPTNGAEEVQSLRGGKHHFANVLPDRLRRGDRKNDELAEDAADEIFALRRARVDLVTGEMGEGVFGAGLESALKEIDRMEQSYMELFYGKRTLRRITERVVVPIADSVHNYVVARFNTEEGIVSKDDLSGEVVVVNITPSEMNYPEGEKRGKIVYRYANNATVTVALSGDMLCRRVLPIFELGATVYYKKPW